MADEDEDDMSGGGEHDSHLGEEHDKPVVDEGSQKDDDEIKTTRRRSAFDPTMSERRLPTHYRCIEPLRMQSYSVDGFLKHCVWLCELSQLRSVFHRLEVRDDWESFLFGSQRLPKDVIDCSSFLSTYEEKDGTPAANSNCEILYSDQNCRQLRQPTSFHQSPYDAAPPSDVESVWSLLTSRVDWQNKSSSRSNTFTPVGRATFFKQPSLLALGMLHYSKSEVFDMHLVLHKLQSSQSTVYPPYFYPEQTDKPNTFIVSFNYILIKDTECEPPMPWQMSASEGEIGSWTKDLPLSQCNTIVALSFPQRELYAVDKTAPLPIINAYSAWELLCIEACPDQNVRLPLDWHDESPIFNGCQLFWRLIRTNLILFVERTSELIRSINELVQPPSDAPFNPERIENLLFDDENFTNSRKYFWASKTLDVIQQDIEKMLKNFDVLLAGSTVSDLNEKDSSGFGNQDLFWRLKTYRMAMEGDLDVLKGYLPLIDEIQRKIKDLFDNLYSMTSVRESRLSAEMARATVFQGRNIKLLTVVSLIYLPLSFVASVFGMTNMPQASGFLPFGYTTLAVCLPTYLLLAILLPTQGLDFWRTRLPRSPPRWSDLTLRHRFKKDLEVTRGETSSSQGSPRVGSSGFGSSEV